MPSTATSAFATPRRLTLVVDGPAAASSRPARGAQGPRVGAPGAGDRRASCVGLAVSARPARGARRPGRFFFAHIRERGRPTTEIVAETGAEAILRACRGRSRCAGAARTFRWVRPLQAILCLFDGEVVPFQVRTASQRATSTPRPPFHGAGAVHGARLRRLRRQAAQRHTSCSIGAERRALISRAAEELAASAGNLARSDERRCSTRSPASSNGRRR